MFMVTDSVSGPDETLQTIRINFRHIPGTDRLQYNWRHTLVVEAMRHLGRPGSLKAWGPLINSITEADMAFVLIGNVQIVVTQVSVRIRLLGIPSADLTAKLARLMDTTAEGTVKYKRTMGTLVVVPGEEPYSMAVRDMCAA